jgi:endonuclease/exonuclease/phosphatase family metal-dependent hydrolase
VTVRAGGVIRRPLALAVVALALMLLPGTERSSYRLVDMSGGSDLAFTVASFNTLGSNHTSASGKEPELASGPQRTPGAIALLEAHGVDVAGLQEFQTPQYKTFTATAGDTWAAWSAPDDTENAVVWRRDRFDLVSGRLMGVPYFGGHDRQMPVVRLRDRQTGREYVFVNVHNPADTRRFPRQAAFRAQALTRERAYIQDLHAGVPVILTGDMNDTHDVYCVMTAGGLLDAAGGGGQGCKPPADHGIDWIFASSGMAFSDYVVDRTPRRNGTSDHPIVVTTVTPTH